MKNFISTCKSIMIPALRVSIAIVFIWFGWLKVIGISPATPLVEALHNVTIVSSIDFGTFMIFFGLFEVLIGILFLFKKASKIAITLLAIHMVTTLMPLFLLPKIAWSGFLVPTLEGQYIIKNLVIIAAAIAIAGHMHKQK
ncbi:MAG TPA: hypothetical protein PK886_00895 [Candidatus Paceibacterota bacterium]|nr:hypothetical protein [Candidatus Paceibacterota bacterium]